MHPEDPQGEFINIWLSASDLEILNRFRGDLSPDQFLDNLLKMIDSNKVSGLPIGDILKPKGNRLPRR